MINLDIHFSCKSKQIALVLTKDAEGGSSLCFQYLGRHQKVCLSLWCWYDLLWSCIPFVLKQYIYLVILWNFLCVKLRKAKKTQCLKMLLFLFSFADGCFLCVPYLLMELKYKLFNVFLDALAWKKYFYLWPVYCLVHTVSWALGLKIPLECAFLFTRRENRTLYLPVENRISKNRASENLSCLF